MVISKIRTEKDSNLLRIKEVTKATKPQPTSKQNKPEYLCIE